MLIDEQSHRIIAEICERVRADWPKTREALLRAGNFKAALELDPERVKYKTTLKLISRGLIRNQEHGRLGPTSN